MKMLKIKDIEIGEGIPKVIIPLMGTTDQELLEELEVIKDLKPDIIEWRADAYSKVEDLAAIQNLLETLSTQLLNIPLIFTFRTYKEGGMKEIAGDYYSKLLKTVIQTKKADLVDVELFTGETNVKEVVTLAEENGVYIIISNHDFQQTPAKDEIIRRLETMKLLGGHISKIAVTPKNVQDILTLLEATNTVKNNDRDHPLITMSMGPLGLFTRLSGELFGSACTFGAGRMASAPGQIPADELRIILNIFHKYLEKGTDDFRS